LASRLDKGKYTVHVACRQRGIFCEKILKVDANLIALNMRSKFNVGNLFKLVKIIRSNDIHLVHSQGARADFFVRIAAGLLKKRPRIVSTIQMPVEGFDAAPLRKKIYRTLDKISERYVDKFVTVSDTLKKQLIQGHEIAEGKIAKIYNGIELEEYEPDSDDRFKQMVRQEFGIPDSAFLIGAIGRIVWQKGFESLIRALPKIGDRLPEAKMLIVGEGPQTKKLEKLARRLSVDQALIFAGLRDDVKSILSGLDVLVIPSLLEGFPMITLEAMAMAKPIIASNVVGISEQIADRENGILVQPGDITALTKEIIRLAGDKKKAEMLGWAARKRVEREFSVQKMVRQTEDVYRSILEL